MALSAKQVAELEKPLDATHVSVRSQSGRQLSYIEGWHAIAEANRIFGFDGWRRETIDMREVRAPEQISNRGKTTWRVGFICKVRVTVGDIVREGTGYGSGALPDLGEAYESAVKEAETDAMKRALMTFGNPFGLALYDKDRANVVTAGEPATSGRKSSSSDDENPFDSPPDDEVSKANDIARYIDGCRDMNALKELWHAGWVKDFLKSNHPSAQEIEGRFSTKKRELISGDRQA